jgi:hypothetical protein
LAVSIIVWKHAEPNHFAEPNQQCLTFLHPIFFCRATDSPSVELLGQTRPCVGLFFRKIVMCTSNHPQEALAKFGYRSKRKVEILKNPALL